MKLGNGRGKGAVRERRAGGRSLSICGLAKGQEFRVVGVALGREIGKRLADMGFVRGARGRIVRSALLGDPLQVKILDYDVSIRRAEAAGVAVEIVGKDGEDR